MPKFPVQYGRILFRLTDGLSGDTLEAALQAFLHYVKEEGAIAKMPYILKEYEQIANAASDHAPLTITAAQELTTEIKKIVETAFGGTIDTVTLDPTLIGGVIVRKGNTIFDVSIKQQLESLANSMK